MYPNFCKFLPQTIQDPEASITPTIKKRKRSPPPPIAPSTSATSSNNEIGAKASSRKPTLFHSAEDLLNVIQTSIRERRPIDMTASYFVRNDPEKADKHRVQLFTHELWIATGYRFTVKDHPLIPNGHKTRLWCSQDELRGQHKSKSKNRPKGAPIPPRIRNSGEPFAKARFPCKSRLIISSKDAPEKGAGWKEIMVRLVHAVAHEPYASNGNGERPLPLLVAPPRSPRLPLVTVTSVAEEVPMAYLSSGTSEADNEASAVLVEAQEKPLPTPPPSHSPSLAPHSSSPPTEPEAFKSRMRAHIGNIRDFCDGLEYQLQFNQWELLHTLESDGAGFLNMVRDCLQREGRWRQSG